MGIEKMQPRPFKRNIFRTARTKSTTTLKTRPYHGSPRLATAAHKQSWRVCGEGPLRKISSQKRASFFTVASRPAVNEQKINKLKNFRGNNRNGALRKWAFWKPGNSGEAWRFCTVPTGRES